MLHRFEGLMEGIGTLGRGGFSSITEVGAKRGRNFAKNTKKCCNCHSRMKRSTVSKASARSSKDISDRSSKNKRDTS